MEASSYIVGSFVGHFAALALMSTSMPDMELRQDEIADDQEFRVYQIYIEAERGGLPMAGLVHCCSRDTARGASDATVNGQRYGVEGPADNPDPHVSRYDDGEDVYLYTSVNGGPSVIAIGTQAPPAPWGRDEALGTDPIDARGAVWGDTIGDSSGDDGLGHLGAEAEEESKYGYRCRMP